MNKIRILKHNWLELLAEYYIGEFPNFVQEPNFLDLIRRAEDNHRIIQVVYHENNCFEKIDERYMLPETLFIGE